MKYYTSDLHLQHTNVLKYDERPFSTIEEHDLAVIDIINQTVWVDDQLYILWDISWKANKSIDRLSKIKCRNIYFLIGNHDFSNFIKIYEKLWWTNLWLMHIDNESNVVLCHYPMEEWYHSNHKDLGRYIHIHWHSHWNSIQRYGRIDVWLTFKDVKTPLSLNTIKSIVSDIDEWIPFHAKQI